VTDLVDVVVKVPSDRIADLYAMVAQLNRAQARPQAGATTRPGDEKPGDFQDLVRMFREIAQDLLRHAA
jgi:hypothetical protein